MSSGGVADSLRSRREEIAARRGEPVQTYERSVLDLNGGLYANLPELAVQMLDLKKGQQVKVAVHDDRIVIRPDD